MSRGNTLRGYAQYEPDLNYTSTGKALAKLDFVDSLDNITLKDTVNFWEGLAEAVHVEVKAGDKLFLRGYFRYNDFTDCEEFTANRAWFDKDGEMIEIKRQEVITDTVNFKPALDGIKKYAEHIYRLAGEQMNAEAYQNKDCLSLLGSIGNISTSLQTLAGEAERLVKMLNSKKELL